STIVEGLRQSPRCLFQINFYSVSPYFFQYVFVALRVYGRQDEQGDAANQRDSYHRTVHLTNDCGGSIAATEIASQRVTAVGSIADVRVRHGSCCGLTPQFSGRELPREARRMCIMKWRTCGAPALTYH